MRALPPDIKTRSAQFEITRGVDEAEVHFPFNQSFMGAPSAAPGFIFETEKTKIFQVAHAFDRIGDLAGLPQV